MVAETLYTFTAADITSVVIECTACGHGIVIGHLEIPAQQPGALRCPGCEREWWLMRDGGPPAPERRLIEALLEIRQRVGKSAAAVKLQISTQRTGGHDAD